MIMEWLGNVLGGRRNDWSGTDGYGVVENVLVKE